MPPAPLASRALEDQLRRMQLQIDALERRMPTGDAQPWNLTIETGGGTWPSYSVDAHYIRMNNILFAWGRITFTSAGSAGWAEDADVRVYLPYEVETIQNGVWHGFLGTGPGAYIDGVMGGFNGVAANYVDLTGRTTFDKVNVISNKGFRYWSIAAGGYVTGLWSVNDTIDLLIVARIPDGS